MSVVVKRPLRNLVLVSLRPVAEMTGRIHRVSHFEPSRWADVKATGPECRDVRVGMGVLVNPLVGTVVGDDLVVPESSILATDADAE